MIKIGVIGTGSMGRNHVRNITELVNRYQLIGFHDVNEENINFIREKYGIAYYDDINQLIEKTDALVVAVPSSLHYKIGLNIALKNKHLLVEKPITLNEAEGKELCDKFSAQKKVLMTGHIERYNPVVTEIKKVVNQEGGVIALDTKRCSPFHSRSTDANVIFDLMIHDIDIVINCLYPHPVKTVDAKAVAVMSGENLDYAQAMLQFESGVIATLLSSKVTEDKIRMIDVHTKKSFIRGDLLNKTLLITRKASVLNLTDYTPLYSQENVVEKVILPNIEPLKAELIEFADAIEQKREGLTNGRIAVKALHFAEIISNLCKKE